MRLLTLFLIAPVACAPNTPDGGVAPAPALESPEEDDFSMPDWVEPVPGTGFFSEFASPQHGIFARSVDVTWAQINPAPGVIDRQSAGEAMGDSFAPLGEQLAIDGAYWMRVWASSASWAPAWVVADCGVEPLSADAEGEAHLPMWNACLWSHLSSLYVQLFVDEGMAADPDLLFVYVPGGFSFVEFDFDVIGLGVEEQGLTIAQFDAWFHDMTGDLVGMFGANAGKLVYTGEDYPFGPFGADDDLYARDAVAAGMGIRNGINELCNFHLSEVPAYGAGIGADGHLVTDESWELFDGRVIAAESECYQDCGFFTDDLYYAVKMSNLKALQLRVNHLYAVPEDSFMEEFRAHWEHVRLSLGRTAADSPDAWVALRTAEDRYWVVDEPGALRWDGYPFVRNLERFLVEKEGAPGAASRPGRAEHRGVLAAENGLAIEGRRTDVGNGQPFLAFDVDERFLSSAPVPIELRVTLVDEGDEDVLVETGGGGLTVIARGNTGRMVTRMLRLDDAVMDGSLDGGVDLRLSGQGGTDIEVRFVRLVKLEPPG